MCANDTTVCICVGVSVSVSGNITVYLYLLNSCAYEVHLFVFIYLRTTRIYLIYDYVPAARILSDFNQSRYCIYKLSL